MQYINNYIVHFTAGVIVIIKRQTRPNLQIDNIDDLILHINKVGVKKLKRCSDSNRQLLYKILESEHHSSAEFKKEMQKSWKHAYKDLSVFGWSDAEILEETNIRTETKKRALATSLKNTGMSESEYRRSRQNLCPEFWIRRGYSVEAAKLKIKEIQSSNSKKVQNQQKRESSPRTLDYWIKKGVHNPEERRSLFQRESSKRCPEYWMNRGCTYTEALEMVSSTQRESAACYYNNTSISDIRTKNRLCVEYYQAKGLTEEEIAQQLKDNGRTFSLEMCQAKYGEDDGFVIWQERQKKWQQTLNEKSPEELKVIREKQGIMSGRKWDTLNVPGIFYIIQISSSKLKIGITIRDIDKRYAASELSNKRIHVHPVDDIQTAYAIEQSIKRNHLAEIKKADYGVFGWTEVLDAEFDDVLNELTELINKDNLNLLKEHGKNENNT